MILYNITFNIEPEIQNEWHIWMKNIYLPFVMETELFFDVKMFRMLNEAENQGLTYSVQFFSHSLEMANQYLDNHAPGIVKKHNEAFRHKHVSFMTILESVD
jgi:hypothetical protein